MCKNQSTVLQITKVICFTLILLCLIQFSQAQETMAKESVYPKNLVSINIMGTTPIVGITYQRNLLNRIGLEVGVGYLLSYGAGAKIYVKPIAHNKFNFYLGASYAHWEFLAPFSYVYIVPGLSYNYNDRFNISMGVGGAYLNDIMFDKWSWQPWGNFSFGILF